MSVVKLSESMINQIAAGEVVERPASVVKELIENAIDAGATRIELATSAGGKNLIRVSDNGKGMSKEDLTLAIQRHCTSKLTDDLLDIQSLGFRGEALPSIGSIARLSISTRQSDTENGWQITVDNSEIEGPYPAALSQGSVVEVSGLFAKVPARLKFMKSDRAETSAITDVFKRMALAFPQIHFNASGSDRATLNYPAATLSNRIAQVLGSEFIDNALEIDAEREQVTLSGFVSLPTYNRGNALNQFFYINGRPVKDKGLLGAVRGAYSDFLPRDRHSSLVLFIEIDNQEVDVNVHPAKADVRFRDPALVRGLLVGSIKQAILAAGHRASNHSSNKMQDAFNTGNNVGSPQTGTYSAGYTSQNSPNSGFSRNWNSPNEAAANTGFAESPQQGFSTIDVPSGRIDQAPYLQDNVSMENVENPLGAARTQIHENYIVSQTQNGLIIVDAHAAHERIVYEKLKEGLKGQIPSQILLIPEIIDLPEEDVDRLCEASESLQKLGLILEKFGPGAIAVRETPALLGEIEVTALIKDLADELAEWGVTQILSDRLEYVAATMACHGSVRSGRLLKPDEMNALLRQMENTPNSGQCNHGRPTYIELGLKDIERLFGR